MQIFIKQTIDSLREEMGYEDWEDINEDALLFQQGYDGDIIEVYNNQDVSFDIISNTCTIDKATGNKKYLLDGKTRFIIPVYQRPYSWGSEQINQFVSDLISGFLGLDRSGKTPEPMFIGTMQLSSSKFVSKNEIWQDVIDGPNAKMRREEEVDKMFKYLFNEF